jgi:hypothetical protein
VQVIVSALSRSEGAEIRLEGGFEVVVEPTETNLRAVFDAYGTWIKENAELLANSASDGALDWSLELSMGCERIPSVTFRVDCVPKALGLSLK